MSAPSGHIPVFLEATLEAFRAVPGPIREAWDGTFGRGGHSAAILREHPEAKMWAMDWDADAIAFGRANYPELIAAGRLNLIRAAYSELDAVLEASPEIPRAFDAMLLDLGVSSPQLDEADRGFSFYHDGPLDMRMDRSRELTAADIVNEWEEQDLARLFMDLGEVQRPFRVVRAIMHDRKTKPYRTTRDLAGLIERVDGWRKKGTHPATQYFLALRLEVNAELRQLEAMLPKLVARLAPGGVLVVISFHSLEDRIVKNGFKSLLQEGKLLNKKARKATFEEAQENPRTRSAKLRAFQKAFEPADAPPAQGEQGRKSR